MDAAVGEGETGGDRKEKKETAKKQSPLSLSVFLPHTHSIHTK